MKKPPSRSRAIAALATTVLLLAGCGSPQAAENQNEAQDPGSKVLRVGLYGGTWMEAVKKTAASEFEKNTGARVEFVQGNPSDLATQLYAASGQGTDVPMDVIETDSLTQTQLASRNLLVPTSDYAKDVFGDVTAEPLNEGMARPHCDWYVVIAYNTEKFAELGLPAPTSWESLFDPKLAGKVSIPDITVAQSTATIAAAAGVATADPTDLSAGVRKLKELKPYSIYRSSSDVQTDMANGNVWAAALSDGRAWQLVDNGQPVKVAYASVPGPNKLGPQAGQCFLDVVKGTKNTDLAAEFVKASYSAKVQAEFGRLTGYTPTSPAALDELQKDPAWGQRIQNPDEVVKIDWHEYAKTAQDLVAEFNRTLGS
jgi:putative spermidine/putrescine transport system substrate-binding protein